MNLSTPKKNLDITALTNRMPEVSAQEAFVGVACGRPLERQLTAIRRTGL